MTFIERNFIEIALVVFLSTMLLIFLLCPTICVGPIYSKIISVGGCDKNGRCAILLADGKKDRASYPLIGDSHLSSCKKQISILSNLLK